MNKKFLFATKKNKSGDENDKKKIKTTNRATRQNHIHQLNSLLKNVFISFYILSNSWINLANSIFHIVDEWNERKESFKSKDLVDSLKSQWWWWWLQQRRSNEIFIFDLQEEILIFFQQQTWNVINPFEKKEYFRDRSLMLSKFWRVWG